MSTISNPGAIRQGSWDAGFSYNARDIVLGNDGRLYSAAAASAGSDPVGDLTGAWQPVPVTQTFPTTAALLAGAGSFPGQFLSTVSGSFAVATGPGVPGAATLQNSSLSVQRLLGATGGAEHHLSSASTGTTLLDANVLSLQHLNIGEDSAARFLDYLGNERGAVGYGNPGQDSYFPFGGRNYFEISDVNNTGLSPQFILVQSSTFNGSKSYGTYGKLHLDSDGTLYLYPNGKDGNHLGAANANFTFAQAGDAPTGTALLTMGAYPGGAGQACLRAGDENHQIFFREGISNTICFYEYGGAFATGSGIRFSTGGLKASQTLRFHVADDRTQVTTPFNLKPQARPAAALEGDLYQDATDHHLYLFNGALWKQLDN